MDFDYVKKLPPPGGLEPPTFRLTAERASQLRHGGYLKIEGQKYDYFIFFFTETKEGENMLKGTAEKSGTMVAPIRKVRTKYKIAFHYIQHRTEYNIYSRHKRR